MPIPHPNIWAAQLETRSRTHAPWLWPERTTLSPGAAIGLVLVLWFGRFAPGTINAAAHLAGQWHASTHSAWWWASDITEDLGRAGLLFVACLALVRFTAPGEEHGGPSDPVRRPRNLYASLWIGLASTAFTAVGFLGQWIVDLCLGTQHNYPTTPDTWGNNISDDVNAALAGPTEEILFCLTTLTLLRRAGLKWRWVAMICLTLRLTFHIYYGWGVIALIIIWAGLVMLLYVTEGRWLAIAIAHSLFDLKNSHITPIATLAWSTAVICLAVAVIQFARHKTPESHPTPPTT